MTTISSVASIPESGLKGLAKRYPLTAYFILAFALMWVFVIPIALSQNGVGVITLPDALIDVFFLVATFSGPLPAAFIMTNLLEGREGRRRLFRRMFQWRVGLGWYLFLLIGYPLMFLAGLSIYQGVEPWLVLVDNWQLILTFYLPAVAFSFIVPSLGEEPGWRGFALPRLQKQYGPLSGTLILGVLHGLWHFPIYFVPGSILEGPFEITAVAASIGLIIAMTVIWTWFFNHAGQSVFFAMLVHGVSNAASGFIPQLPLDAVGDPWFSFKTGAVFAVLLIVFTRGRLGYQPEPSTDNK